MTKRMIDLRGEVCPRPVIVTLNEIKKMKKGDILEIVTDEELACKSIPEECKKYGMSAKVEKFDKSWKIIIMRKK